MTDLQRWLQLLQDWGVEYLQQQDEDTIGVTIEADTQGVRGYWGFCCEAVFDMEGRFTTFVIFE